MANGDVWTLATNAQKTEGSTVCPPIYEIKMLRNDATSGSISFGLNVPIASGSSIVLGPGEMLSNLKFEFLTRLYYSTALESASPAFRMVASTKRIE
jgi:hypothetical protein